MPNPVDLILIFSILYSGCSQELKKNKYDIAYQRFNKIYVKRFSDKKEIFINNGMYPVISSNGNKLAYTKDVDSKTDINRYIVIVDLSTMKETKLNVPYMNNYNASWSPDNLYISFLVSAEDNWHVGIINSDNSNFRIINSESYSNIGLVSTTWTNDSKYIIAHNLDIIYKFDLNGNLVDTININKNLGKN